MTTAKRISASLSLFAALTLGAALSGCSREEALAPPIDDAVRPEAGDASQGAIALGGARLRVTTADPDQYYARWDTDPWFFFSTITHAEFFDLVIVNESRRTARDLELLVTVPGDLGPGAWLVLIDGMYFSSVEDFPDTDLRKSRYPRLPHGVYQPQGNAVFYRLQGPSELAPGERWVLPVQLSRGVSDDFKVHFVVASSNGLWSSPLHDVTAQPPYDTGGGGEERPMGEGRGL